jgi:hypothetical protein
MAKAETFFFSASTLSGLLFITSIGFAFGALIGTLPSYFLGVAASLVGIGFSLLFIGFNARALWVVKLPRVMAAKKAFYFSILLLFGIMGFWMVMLLSTIRNLDFSGVLLSYGLGALIVYSVYSIALSLWANGHRSGTST